MDRMLIAFAAVALLALASIGYMAWHVSESNAIDNLAVRNPQAAGAGVQAGGNLAGEAGSANPAGAGGSGAQIIKVRATQYGTYDNPTVYAKANVPINFQFTADSNAGCGRLLIIDKVGVRLVSKAGEAAQATFTAAPGTYPFHCGMNMFRGQLVVR